MNRYPFWINAIVIVAVIFGGFYTFPNFLGEAPGIQISSNKLTVKINHNTIDNLNRVLTESGITPQKITLENSIIRIQLQDVDEQFLAKKALDEKFNPKRSIGDNAYTEDYVVALSPLPNTPDWMQSLSALPMSLGLDLRGGVHFLMQVDMEGAIEKKLDTLSITARQRLRDLRINVNEVVREDDRVIINFTSKESLQKSHHTVNQAIPELEFTENKDGVNQLIGILSEDAISEAKDNAVEKNILTLRNRVDQLGVSEPSISKQGQERIVVQLPGLQDPTRAKQILGRTATLELRMVSAIQDPKYSIQFSTTDPNEKQIWLSKQVQLTGDNLIDASGGFSSRDNIPAVHLSLDSSGARIIRNLSRENIGKRMAIILYEKGIGTVITAPVFRSEIPNGQMEISGAMRLDEAHDLALLLRAGSLAAPMEIIEERTIGPSLGKENIERGFTATLWGFIAVIVFITIYYTLFGVFSSLALFFNLVLLIAALSFMQATLTLPGIAAIALTLGMAIDANVLINERIREEVRGGATPSMSIYKGYDRAFTAILDSNISTLIAGIALLIFASGPVRGFAIVHCLGILTSMFSAIVGSRALVNWWYGRKQKITKLQIG